MPRKIVKKAADKQSGISKVTTKFVSGTPQPTLRKKTGKIRH